MKQQFYEPLIQEEQEPMQIRGFQVQIGGIYVLMDDVVTALRTFAQSLEDPDDGILIHEVANWLQSGQVPPAVASNGPPTYSDAPVSTTPEIHGQESDDMTPDVDRVELFPREESRGKKWFARSIDTAGNVMKETHGSFDKPFVEGNARDRWPGIPIYEVQDEYEFSMRKERGKRGYHHSLWTGHHA